MEAVCPGKGQLVSASESQERLPRKDTWKLGPEGWLEVQQVRGQGEGTSFVLESPYVQKQKMF